MACRKHNRPSRIIGITKDLRLIGFDTHKVNEKTAPAEWPAEGLESVAACPVCSSAQRRVLYSGLRDRVFFCAKGEWTLQECLSCGSAYLDPRPTPDTIHLAYQTYYTHQKTDRLPAKELRGARWLQRLLANGYKNWRFGADYRPSNILGVPIAFLLPPMRAVMDREFRHLPRPFSGARLLDIGFGDGKFLEDARAIGWGVVGIDPDPEVVKNARELGLDVHTGLEAFTVEAGLFDVITISHVMEHVHEPKAVLEACYRLLKPGGRLWLETPNIKSLGASRFRHSWRGLEPPRHLVLFNRQSLRAALGAAGFSSICDLPQPSPSAVMYAMSQRIEDGLDPNIEIPVPALTRAEAILARLVEWAFKSRKEFIAMMATKGAN
jgi:2-polyprenyl-3-methyl-5-hydroxy-6-metoxy-1,4-benzoquinol methylase